MNRKIFLKRILEIAIVAVTFISCEFEPEGEIFVMVPEPDLSTIEIGIDRFDDTLRIIEPVRYNFDFDLKGRERPNVDIMLDGKVIQESIKDNNISFYINPKDYVDGNYILSIEIVTNSGSGSFADVSGAEKIGLTREIPVIIDTDLPLPLTIQDFVIENGKSYFLYDKIDTFKVEEAIFLANGVEVARLKNFKGQEDVKYYYSSYTGRDSTVYRIDQKTRYGFVHGKPFTYFDTLPDFRVSFTEDNNIRFQWDAIPYFNNDIKITIEGTYEETDHYTGVKKLFEVDNKSIKGDYILELEMPLRLDKAYFFRMDIESIAAYERTEIREDFKYIGTQVEPVEGIVHSKEMNTIFTYHWFNSSLYNKDDTLTLTKRNPKTLEVIKKRRFNIDGSTSFETLVGSNNGDYMFVNFDRYSYVLDTTDLTMRQYPGRRAILDVSNNGVSCYIGNDGIERVYSIKKAIVYKSKNGTANSTVSINGKYFFFDGNIYQINENDTIELITSITRRNFINAQFDKNDENVIYISYLGGFNDYIVEAFDLSISKEPVADVHVSSYRTMNQDPISGKVFIHSSWRPYNITIWDYKTGQVQEVFYEDRGYAYNYFLLDDKIFSSSGRMATIDNLK